MKKLNKINLKNSRLLSDKEMKQVFGGSGVEFPDILFVECHADCTLKDGAKVEVKVICSYGCGAADDDGAWCIHSNGDKGFKRPCPTY